MQDAGDVNEGGIGGGSRALEHLLMAAAATYAGLFSAPATTMTAWDRIEGGAHQ